MLFQEGKEGAGGEEDAAGDADGAKVALKEDEAALAEEHAVPADGLQPRERAQLVGTDGLRARLLDAWQLGAHQLVAGGGEVRRVPRRGGEERTHDTIQCVSV